jgi:hypothetical protein
MFKKILYLNLLKKYIKQGFSKVAVCPSYIWDARFLKVKERVVLYVYSRRAIPLLPL